MRMRQRNGQENHRRYRAINENKRFSPVKLRLPDGQLTQVQHAERKRQQNRKDKTEAEQHHDQHERPTRRGMNPSMGLA